jgi:hypothetical protein
MRIDETLVLLPLIGQGEAERMLTQVDVPPAVIARALTRPTERRNILQSTFQE